MHDFLEIVRREAHAVVAARQYQGTVVTTAYDPKTRSIKGVLVPSGVETGWIPLATLHAGDGYGIGAGPKCGSAEKLDGAVFEVSFQGGDPNTPVANLQHHSAEETPPEVQSGEIILNHESGMKDKFSKDGSRTMTHGKGQTDTWDAQGNKIKDLKGLADKVFAGIVVNNTPKKVITGIVHIATGGTV